jgi:hypothetical protein
MPLCGNKTYHAYLAYLVHHVFCVIAIPNVIQESVLAKLAPRILIRRSRRTNSSLLEIGGYFCGSKGWDASAAKTDS